jgi:DNA-binding transcriptional ArsR family regulator
MYACDDDTAPATAPADEPLRALEAASDLLKALASPVRLGIVRELSEGGKYVHEPVAALGVSQPLISQHLRVLRNSHIVLDAIRHAQE